MLVARPGMVFTYSVASKGVAANGVGGRSANSESDLIYRINRVDASGLGFEFALSGATQVNGVQTIPAADLSGAHLLHTALKGGDNSATGTLAFPRLSDAVYRDIKAGKPTGFGFDGPDSPKLLTPDGADSLEISIDDKPVKLAALRARGSNGCHIWIADQPAFPMLLKSDCGSLLVATAAYDPKVVSAALVNRLAASDTATTSTILFDFNSASLQPQSKPVLDALGAYLKKYTDRRLIIEGHTDNVGTAAKNLALSVQRAEAVKTYLLTQSGIAANRLTTKGYGFNQAVANNTTPEGRSRNRRVAFKPTD